MCLVIQLVPNLDEFFLGGGKNFFAVVVALFASKSGLLMRPPSGVFTTVSENPAGGADTLAPPHPSKNR